MEQKDFGKRLFVGLFFLMGIGLIVSAIFVIGLEKGMTQPKFQVTVYFKAVGGLMEGAPIRLSGVNVGVVNSIDFADDEIAHRNIRAVLKIFKKYEKQFKNCSKVAIKTEGVLGEKFIEISMDPRRKIFDLGRPIIGEDPLDVEDMAEVLTTTALSLKKTTDGLNDLMKELGYLSRKSKRLLNRVEDRIIQGNLFKVF